MDDYQLIYQEPHTVFEITLKDTEDQTLARLSIEIPSLYPNEIPLIKVVRIVNETSQKIQEIEAFIKTESDNRRGAPMIYELCDATKEFILTKWPL
jgi:hypothetical protein